jgi:signal peptidase I
LHDLPPPPKPSAPKPSGLRDILSVGGVLASALLLAFILINFVFQSYQVEGPSMQRTLENGDHLLVWKVDKSIAKFTGNHYIPKRGDVVIFDEPSGAEPGGPAGKQLIKRVIALPGERVVFSGTSVTVYNDEHPEGFSPDDSMPYGDKLLNEKPSNYETTVPEGQVVVAGDHRDNSLDSRVFGPVESDLIVGRLIVRILPLNTFKTF